MHERLRDLRKRAGFTQAQIARLVGISPGSVSNVESGARLPSIEVLERWVSACGAMLAILDVEDQTVKLSAALGDEDRAIISDLMRLLPHLDPSLRITLRALLQAWDQAAPAVELSRNVTKKSS